MRSFPVSGAEISIRSRIFTGTIRVCLALDICTLTKFNNLIGAAGICHSLLYNILTGKDSLDIKVNSSMSVSFYTEFLSQDDKFTEYADL